ncbi:DUF5074 domain-containing protein [[Flexibacter] sp. ATCC 35208]|uniref:DUF5074 domain-containing protein n=1 Tax=[Flexibacter] sp. ATCC 35208 TaxID=1936242 RepID=UPI0009CFCF66|nr:DUF5074 domain-containing protein [[Flexibacter] sp. ATCC 35208]OMP77119.1 hypothetical protein BW716_21315 [[Flexibacter] sp. ATCC 35208]
MQRKLHTLLLAFAVFFVVSCKKDDNTSVISKGTYDNGYFILNEGNFGSKGGDLSFRSYNADTLSQDNYLAVNPSSPLATTSTTLEYGTIYNGKLYLVTNYGGPLVAADEYSLKESARNAGLPASGHAFIGIDNSNGLLSTDDGIYPVTLSSLSVGTKITGVSGSVSDMLKSGNYVFALTANDGIVALKTSDYSIAKNLGTAIAGFAQGKDGYIYAAQTNALLKIDPSTLKVDTITTSFNVRYNEWVFTSSSIVASTQENAVYVLSDDQKIYRYVSGNNSSLSSAYITLPDDHYFYGKGIGYDAAKNTLVLITTGGFYGDANNTLYTYSAADATLKSAISYTDNLYPAMVVFH